MDERQRKDLMEINDLVDQCSFLADERDLNTQALIFAEDAELSVYVDGRMSLAYKGRDEIEAFSRASFAGVGMSYHLNGQKSFDVEDSQRATGKIYCTLTMDDTSENDTPMRHRYGLIFSDIYDRRDSLWYIASRTVRCVWAE